MLVGTTRLGIADAKIFVGDDKEDFGVAGLFDNSAAVGIPGVGFGEVRVELPSSAGRAVDEESSDASGWTSCTEIDD